MLAAQSSADVLTNMQRRVATATPRRVETALVSLREGAVAGRAELVVVPNIRPMLPEGVYHWTAAHPEWKDRCRRTQSMTAPG